MLHHIPKHAFQLRDKVAKRPPLTAGKARVGGEELVVVPHMRVEEGQEGREAR